MRYVVTVEGVGEFEFAESDDAMEFLASVMVTADNPGHIEITMEEDVE